MRTPQKVRETHTKLIVTCDQNREKARQKEGNGARKGEERKEKWGEEKKKQNPLYFFAFLCVCEAQYALWWRKCAKIRENDYLFPPLCAFFPSSTLLYYHPPTSSFYSPAVSFVLPTSSSAHLIVCQVHR